jgi:hypothetical protein
MVSTIRAVIPVALRHGHRPRHSEWSGQANSSAFDCAGIAANLTRLASGSGQSSPWMLQKGDPTVRNRLESSDIANLRNDDDSLVHSVHKLPG